MSTLYIGVGGVSRSGKDTLAKSLKNLLLDSYPELKIGIEPLSLPLKNICKSFIKENLNLDVFSDISEEKKLFRDFLVWFGRVKRDQSQGTYWTSLLDERIKYEKYSVCIIPDIRYQQYPKDEVSWLRSKKNNLLIHIKRKISCDGYCLPANQDEATNDDIVRNLADIKLDVETQSPETLNTYINSTIKAFQAEINKKLIH